MLLSSTSCRRDSRCNEARRAVRRHDSTTPTAPCQVAGAATCWCRRPLDQHPGPDPAVPRLSFDRRSFSRASTRIITVCRSSLQRRFADTSQVSVAYTWSKNLTDNQTDRSTAPQNSLRHQQWSTGPCDTRSPSRLHGELHLRVAVLPQADNDFVGERARWLAGVGHHRRTTRACRLRPATSSFRSGGLGFIPALIAGGRPNLLCDPNENAPHTQQQWFNTACFAG